MPKSTSFQKGNFMSTTRMVHFCLWQLDRPRALHNLIVWKGFIVWKFLPVCKQNQSQVGEVSYLSHLLPTSGIHKLILIHHVYWLDISLTLVYWFKKTLLKNILPSHLVALQQCKRCWRLISLKVRNKHHFRLDHHLDHKCKVSRVGNQQAGLRFSPQKYELHQCLCADRSQTHWTPEEAKKETNPEPPLQAANMLVIYFWPEKDNTSFIFRCSTTKIHISRWWHQCWYFRVLDFGLLHFWVFHL